MGMSDEGDAGELPTPEEIADVTDGDADKIRDGFRAFTNMDCRCRTENIEETPGVDRDNRAPSRDYSGRRWFWFLQEPEGQEE